MRALGIESDSGVPLAAMEPMQAAAREYLKGHGWPRPLLLAGTGSGSWTEGLEDVDRVRVRQADPVPVSTLRVHRSMPAGKRASGPNKRDGHRSALCRAVGATLLESFGWRSLAEFRQVNGRGTHCLLSAILENIRRQRGEISGPLATCSALKQRAGSTGDAGSSRRLSALYTYLEERALLLESGEAVASLLLHVHVVHASSS